MAQRKSAGVPGEVLGILKEFSRDKIPFVIVGGVALALHGILRTTVDLDIFVPANTETISRLFSLAAKSKLISSQETILHMSIRPQLLVGQWIIFADKRGYEMLDVYLEDAKAFRALSKRACVRRSASVNYRFASLADIESMKKQAGRPIDRADLVLIQEKRKISSRKHGK